MGIVNFIYAGIKMVGTIIKEYDTGAGPGSWCTVQDQKGVRYYVAKANTTPALGQPV